MQKQRTMAVIHLDRLEANVRNIQRRLGPGTALTAVVKADAYGHGIAGVYPTLRRCGIAGYAVAFWEEGAVLRQAGAEEESILLLAPVRDEELPEVLRYRLTPSLFCLEQARQLNALAASAGVTAPVQIKIDTGMCRIGFPADERGIESVQRIAGMEHLRIQGIFTHFSRADEPDCPQTDRQTQRFRQVLQALQMSGTKVGCVHAANSACVLLRPELQMDAVRCGDVLYGLRTVEEDIWQRQDLREVLTWESYVAMVKTVPAGEEVSYGGTYTTRRDTVIATVPVGFTDGYSRKLSNRGQVKIRGQLAPVLGRVCMDQFMVDVTEIPHVRRGERVELLNGADLSIARMADLAGVGVDEIVCGITKRVPRVYTEQETV